MSIVKAYDSWAEQYDSDGNKTRDLDAYATKEILSQYKFEHVLELGCGTGKNTLWLLEKAKQIIGLDFSSEMLNSAREKIKNKKVRFLKTDLNNKWKVEDQFADLVTSSLTLEHIADLDHIFCQANEKLIENGIFYICELHPFKQYTGSKAKYKTEHGTEELTVFTHHVSDYLKSAEANGFELIELKEWFDDEAEEDLPRLISFVFKKYEYQKEVW